MRKKKQRNRSGEKNDNKTHNCRGAGTGGSANPGDGSHRRMRRWERVSLSAPFFSERLPTIIYYGGSEEKKRVRNPVFFFSHPGRRASGGGAARSTRGALIL